MMRSGPFSQILQGVIQDFVSGGKFTQVKFEIYKFLVASETTFANKYDKYYYDSWKFLGGTWPVRGEIPWWFPTL